MIFCGSLLRMRGPVTPQPVEDEAGNVLVWNGEVFGGVALPEGSNDTAVLLQLLHEGPRLLPHLLASVEGPFAFVYFHVFYFLPLSLEGRRKNLFR